MYLFFPTHPQRGETTASPTIFITSRRRLGERRDIPRQRSWSCRWVWENPSFDTFNSPLVTFIDPCCITLPETSLDSPSAHYMDRDLAVQDQLYTGIWDERNDDNAIEIQNTVGYFDIPLYPHISDTSTDNSTSDYLQPVPYVNQNNHYNSRKMDVGNPDKGKAGQLKILW